MKDGYATNRKDSMDRAKATTPPSSKRNSDIKMSPTAAVSELNYQSDRHPMAKGEARHCKQ